MTLPARMGTYFSLAEVQRVSDPIPAQLESSALRMIAWLDAVRAGIGAPIVLTSFYRSPERNARVEGSDTSDHMNALAVDFYVQGMDLHTFYAKFAQLERDGKIPPYDQLILYPFTTKHAHAGIGARMRHQKLIRVSEVERERTGRTYLALTSLKQIPRVGAVSLGVLLVLAVLALLFLFAPSTR